MISQRRCDFYKSVGVFYCKLYFNIKNIVFLLHSTSQSYCISKVSSMLMTNKIPNYMQNTLKNDNNHYKYLP